MRNLHNIMIIILGTFKESFKLYIVNFEPSN